jgi:hypothetical protein
LKLILPIWKREGERERGRERDRKGERKRRRERGRKGGEEQIVFKVHLLLVFYVVHF